MHLTVKRDDGKFLFENRWLWLSEAHGAKLCYPVLCEHKNIITFVVNPISFYLVHFNSDTYRRGGQPALYATY